MPHMIPEYIRTSAYTIDGPCGHVYFFASTGREDKPGFDEWLESGACELFADMFGEPADYYWSVEYEPEAKWFYRLSAPGYMDQTDWTGPYDTEAAAKEACSETFDVDADSGESIDG